MQSIRYLLSILPMNRRLGEGGGEFVTLNDVLSSPTHPHTHTLLSLFRRI